MQNLIMFISFNIESNYFFLVASVGLSSYQALTYEISCLSICVRNCLIFLFWIGLGFLWVEGKSTLCPRSNSIRCPLGKVLLTHQGVNVEVWYMDSVTMGLVALAYEGSCIGQGKDSWKNIAWGFQELVVLLSLKDTCICELRVCYCLNEHYWDFGIVSVLFVSLVLRVYFWCFGIWVSHVCERFWECLSLWRLWVLFVRVLWVLFVRVSHVFVVHIVDNRFWLSSTLDVGM